MRLNIRKIRLGDAMALNKKYWVMKMGDFVELRSSIYPIKTIKTKLTRIKIKKQRLAYFDYATSTYKYEIVEKPVKTILEQTYFEGGKILSTYLFHNWSRVAKDLGLQPLKGDCVFTVSREIAVILQRRKG